MKRTLEKVDCSRGAPMGRMNNIPKIKNVGKLYLEKLQWVDGDYDHGGAYWRFGDVEAEVKIFTGLMARLTAKRKWHKLMFSLESLEQ